MRHYIPEHRPSLFLKYNSKMDLSTAKAHIPAPEYFEYTSKEAIIYALGVGAKTKTDLRYVYEMAEDFLPLPTFIVAPGLKAAGIMDWPGIEFDLARILHGEQYIEVCEPLPSEAKLRSEARVVDILDKGSGALILSEITTYDDRTGKKLAMQQIGTFQVGSGKFGGPRTSPHEKPAAAVPSRQPDAVFEEKTSTEQATLYRIGSGDLNPLHIDPMFAKMSGFEEPILHGLCSMGFAARHVINGWAGNDANRFKALKVRFSSPVIPGQTLRTETWKDGNRIIFQTKVKETDKVVISNAWMTLTEIADSPTVTDRLQAKL
ncbi:Peroxisomal multifunctional enzyme [Trichostrongylus colubriformis]|uniref:Peroxisomal multifunctional enzyme n=1 Tax=Trichostrongylus colubriformis TaxID=6319 RepID=A0AAN8IKP0_TRICO